MTRIATLYAFQRSVEAMSERRSALVNTQEQLSTGLRVNRPSDDPLGAAQAERTRARLARIDLERRMMDHAKSMLGQAENAMAGAGDVLQLARESLVAAGNGAASPQDRALMAQRLRQSRDELLSIANTRDGAGGYIFGGQGSSTPPFTVSGAPTFVPNAGEQSTGLEAEFTTSQDGRAIFIDLNAGGTSRSIFQTLDDAITLLEDPNADVAARTAGLQSAMTGVDAAMERLLLKRTQAGEQLRALESRERLLESGEIQATGLLSDLTDLDYAAAISQFQNDQTALNAAMATYAQISRMTLFDHL